VLLPVVTAVPIVLRLVRAAGPAPARAGQSAERAAAAGQPPAANPAEAFHRADVRPAAPERAVRLAEQLVAQPVADAAVVAEPQPVGPAAPADGRQAQPAEAAGSRPAAAAAAAEQRQEAAGVVAQPLAVGRKALSARLPEARAFSPVGLRSASSARALALRIAPG
jgi:hypothetical protein